MADLVDTIEARSEVRKREDETLKEYLEDPTLLLLE
jgi:hypothetical protein